MDFAPGRVLPTAGDDTAPVAEHDRFALGCGEHAFMRFKVDNAACPIPGDTEDTPDAAGMPGRCRIHCGEGTLIVMYPGDPLRVEQVVFCDLDGERERFATEVWHVGVFQRG